MGTMLHIAASRPWSNDNDIKRYNIMGIINTATCSSIKGSPHRACSAANIVTLVSSQEARRVSRT